MASSFYIIEGGVWKKVSEASIYTGSAWNSVSNIYYWNGSAWVKGFTKGFEFTKTITGTTTNFSTTTEATSQGWNGTDSVIANLTLSSSAIIKSSSVSTYAFETTGLPLNSQVNLTLTSGAYIVGRGGAGGIGSFSVVINYPNAGYSQGQPGGPAINIISGVNMNLTNNGTIGGGGGGGGGGNGGEAFPSSGSFQGGSAGGGAGYGDGGPVNPGQGNAYVSGPAGNPGTLTAGGAGVGTINTHSSFGGFGGNGGTLGSAGVNAVNGGSAPYGMYNSAAPGGAAGVAINGWSRITVGTEGTILGAKNN
jgi:hypothetical protein